MGRWQLVNAGLAVELDAWDWATGDDFVRRMSEAIARADRVVALLSVAYLERDRYITHEWPALLPDASSRRLIPVRIEDVRLPEVLRSLRTADLFNRSEQEAQQILIEAVLGGRRPEQGPVFPPVSRPDAQPQLPGALPPIWNVPARNPVFTGRDTVLVRLRERFAANSRGTVVQALTGIGGVGKTRLAAEYAHRFSASYELIWWIDAERADLIGDQLAQLAMALMIVPESSLTPVATQALQAYLRARSGWLLVFDHADNPTELVPWLPSGPGHVLVTSRNPHWGNIGSSVEVDVFSQAESAAFLRAQLPNLSDEDTTGLATRLDGLPLALAQAVGLIAETGMPAAEYFQLLDEQALVVLDGSHPIGYETSLARTVALSMARLNDEDPPAAWLLRICSFLAPEPIPLTLFSDAPDELLPEPLASVARTSLALRRALFRVSRYGLARVDGDTLQLHRLIQGVLRASESEPEPTRSLVEQLLVAADLQEPQDPVGWPFWATLLPHLLAVDPASTKNRRLRRLACDAVWYLLRRGDTSVGESLARRFYEQWRLRFGSDDPHTLNAAQIFAESLRDLRHYQEALDLDLQISDARKRTMGPDHPSTLSAAHNLGIDMRGVGLAADAQVLHREVLERRRQILGDDDPRTLAALHQLGIDLFELGKFDDATSSFEQALEGQRRTRGDDHLETLASANNLAASLRQLGEVTQAREAFEDICDRYRRILGPDHPDTLTSAEGLAATLRAMGDIDAARALDTDTRDRRRRLLGDDHPDAKRSMRIVDDYPDRDASQTSQTVTGTGQRS